MRSDIPFIGFAAHNTALVSSRTEKEEKKRDSQVNEVAGEDRLVSSHSKW